MYQQREKWFILDLKIFIVNNHIFMLEWDLRDTMLPIVTFVAPSFWMNLPLRIIYKLKNGNSRS